MKYLTTIFVGWFALAAFAIPSFARADIETGLVGYWTLDDGSGDVAADSSGNDNDGTLIGGPVWENGQIDGALHFDGIDSYVDTVDILDGATAYTISAWMKRDDAGDWVGVSKGAGSNSARTFISMWTDGNIYWNVSSGSNTFDSVASNDTNWHHVVLVFDGSLSQTSRVTGYLDGADQNLSANWPASAPTLTANFVIGATNHNSVLNYTDGMIDDVRIYSRALSSADVAELYAFEGGPPDETAPVISSIASSTNPTTATITWTTDEAATSTVEYGLTDSYGTASTSASLVTSHSITLTGLTTGETYHFRVSSADSSGNIATSADHTFVPNPDETGPTVPSNVTASAVSGYQIALSWSASTDASGIDEYGIYRDGSLVATTTSTTYRDTSLTPETAYAYQVSATDAYENESSLSSEAEATTYAVDAFDTDGCDDLEDLGDAYTTNNASALPNVGKKCDRYFAEVLNNAANQTLHFNNSQGRLDAQLFEFPFTYIARNIGAGTQADSQVITDPDNDPFVFAGIQIHVTDLDSRNSSHVVAGHRGLVHYTIEGKNTVDGSSSVNDAGANTAPDGRADIKIIGNADKTITVYWQLPNENPAETADSWTAYRSTGALPGTAPEFGDQVYVGLITYASGTEGVPFVGTADSVEFTADSLVDETAPVISSIASSTNPTTATITWTTDEAATSTVEYGLTDSYGTASTSASLVTSHSITITSLAASTIYHFRVSSEDASGNVATSSDLTFTTSAEQALVSGSAGSGLSRQRREERNMVVYGAPWPRTSAGPVSEPESAMSSADRPAIADGSLIGRFVELLISLGIIPAQRVEEARTIVSKEAFFTRDLSIGSTGDDVTLLQKALNSRGFLVAVEGPGSPGSETLIFGGLTREALRKFQESSGLPATGYFGPLTRALLNSSAR